MKVLANRMLRKRFIIFSVVTAILVGFYAYRDRVIFLLLGGGLVFNESDDMGVEMMSVRGRGFCIPRAYFLFSNSLYRDKGVGIDLAMEIDTLQPWLVYGRTSGFFERQKDMDRKEINKYLSRRVRLTVGDKSTSAKNETWKMMLKGARVEGGEKYTRLWKTEKSLTEFDYVLVPSGAKDYSTIIACMSGARCILDAPYDSDISYRIGFDEFHLNMIDELDSRVRKFIDRSLCK